LILHPTKEDTIIASLTALAIAIHVVESSFPSIIPGIKPGFSNIIILICLFAYSFKTAIQVSLFRVFISSILIGTFLSPSFVLSLAGAISSLFFMGVFWLLFKRYAGLIGVSIIASMGHMLGQFYTAYYLYVPHPQLFKMLPVFITISFILGIVNAILAILFFKYQKQIIKKL